MFIESIKEISIQILKNFQFFSIRDIDKSQKMIRESLKNFYGILSKEIERDAVAKMVGIVLAEIRDSNDPSYQKKMLEYCHSGFFVNKMLQYVQEMCVKAIYTPLFQSELAKGKYQKHVLEFFSNLDSVVDIFLAAKEMRVPGKKV